MWIARCVAFMMAFGGASGAPRNSDASPSDPFVIVLGVAQDGGVPHIGCNKECCTSGQRRLVSCLGIVDPESGERWIVDATPNFPEQLRLLDEAAPPGSLAGILLTHGHIGHYTGLMYLGREARDAQAVPVYAMPRMRDFLSRNGPWELLVRLGNIDLRPLEDNTPVDLNRRIRVTPFVVPHRDEYTETVGFVIRGPHRAVAFVPDIDKWERWSGRVEGLIASVDVAFLDGTFDSSADLPGRDMSEIPHPFIVESMARFASLPAEQKARIRFIHLNHSNPALRPNSDARCEIEQAGFAVAEEGRREGL